MYQEFELEIQNVWNVKTVVIPVVIGALGTMSKRIKQISIQKTAILGTAHILRLVLDI